MITLHKLLHVNGDQTTTIHTFLPIKKYTRSDHDGKRIMCPVCEKQHTVYHFSWSSLTCSNCNSSISKYNWLLKQ